MLFANLMVISPPLLFVINCHEIINRLFFDLDASKGGKSINGTIYFLSTPSVYCLFKIYASPKIIFDKEKRIKIMTGLEDYQT